MMGYTPIASQLFVLSLAIADPFSALNQKTDSLCLPILDLLSCALACVAQPIADPFSGLTNVADSSCLLICVSLRGVANRSQTISTDSFGDITTYNYVLYEKFPYNYLKQDGYTENFWVTHQIRVIIQKISE
jgi:hypothetical protein